MALNLKMASNVYFSELNEFCRKYFDANNKVTSKELNNLPKSFSDIKATLFEHLLLFDKVSIKVFGENIPLASMLNFIGIRQVEELLEQKAIDFVLWTPIVTYAVKNIEGVDPIGGGNHSSAPHCDPEKSLELCFNWMTRKPPRSVRRMLTRKIRDHYLVPDKTLAGTAVNITKSAFENGKLVNYGLDPKTKNYQLLDTDDKKTLAKCSGDLLQYSFLMKNGMTSYSEIKYFDFFSKSQNKLKQASLNSKYFNILAEIEQLPDLKSIFHEIETPFDKLIKSRRSKSSKRFRQWLENASNTDLERNEIVKEYVDTIANAKGFFQTAKGKLTKTIVMGSIGAGVGSALAGPVGGIVGATAAKLIDPATDIVLDLVDQFLIDGLTKGWTPKMFFDDLKKLKNLTNGSS